MLGGRDDHGSTDGVDHIDRGCRLSAGRTAMNEERTRRPERRDDAARRRCHSMAGSVHANVGRSGETFRLQLIDDEHVDVVEQRGRQ